METTPRQIGHPRRLFAGSTPKTVQPIFAVDELSLDKTGLDCASCVKPSTVKAARPLLAPSPKEISTLESDLELMTNFVNNMNAMTPTRDLDTVTHSLLFPLRDALLKFAKQVPKLELSGVSDVVHVPEQYQVPDQIRVTKQLELPDQIRVPNEFKIPDQIRVPNQFKMPDQMHEKKCVLPEIYSSLDHINVLTSTDESMVETPRLKIRGSMTMDPNFMLSDMEHLRTIQKEVRSLFLSKKVSDSSSLGYPSSLHAPSTATRISRVLGASPERSRISRISHHTSQASSFGQLTLSPDVFDRANPWFKEEGKTERKSIARRSRSGSLPPHRTIPNADDSQTILALEAAMAARRRAPSPGAIHRMPQQGSSELVSWLRKQATSSKGLHSRRFEGAMYRN